MILVFERCVRFFSFFFLTLLTIFRVVIRRQRFRVTLYINRSDVVCQTLRAYVDFAESQTTERHANNRNRRTSPLVRTTRRPGRLERRNGRNRIDNNVRSGDTIINFTTSSLLFEIYIFCSRHAETV